MKRSIFVGSVLVSVLVYAFCFLAIKKSGIVVGSVSVKEQINLPDNHVNGVISLLIAAKRQTRIRVQRKDGTFLEAYCYGVDVAKYRDAIPCGREGFQRIEGRTGTLWYMEENLHPWLKDGRPNSLRRDTLKLAVQIELESGELYPFSA